MIDDADDDDDDDDDDECEVFFLWLTSRSKRQILHPSFAFSFINIATPVFS